MARFDVNACGGSGDEATAETLVRLRPDGTPKRKYRRTEKSKGPRLYRTRKDPFESVWDEVCQWLTAQPERTGKSVFDELQQRYPGQFANGQLRTLQRHIAGLARQNPAGLRRQCGRRSRASGAGFVATAIARRR